MESFSLHELLLKGSGSDFISEHRHHHERMGPVLHGNEQALRNSFRNEFGTPKWMASKQAVESLLNLFSLGPELLL